MKSSRVRHHSLCASFGVGELQQLFSFRSLVAHASLRTTARDQRLSLTAPTAVLLRVWAVGFCLLMLLSLSACGVKPREVDPPEGTSSNFPRTYPNPKE
jgi:hypothetical protein